MVASARTTDEIKLIDRLNPREKEILPLVSIGLSNKEIGKRLFISDKTVKNYVTSIRKKLQLDNRTQIALFSIRNGIVDPREAVGPSTQDSE
ncbi:MAG: response regulator transcription factor [Bacillota bacterium]|jgi:DNA-binding NarL/FixJ family response regulator|nr:response regulator transcription factor [Bacillota bacterium]